MNSYFSVNVNKYSADKDYFVVRPSSLDYPKDNSVCFVTKGYAEKAKSLQAVNSCLVFWPESERVPDGFHERHTIVKCDNPRIAYGMFFKDNNITNNPKPCEYELINGAYIARTASVGEATVIFPGVLIDAEVTIGRNCYIGAGVKLIGEVSIGDNCVIRENAVLGSAGLTVGREDNGKVITIPQFGSVVLENDVQIGANTVICRGAIDATIIRSGSRISNSCCLSHNVQIGYDTVVVGEAMMFGSSTVGNNSMISGNATLRDGVHVGNCSTVGMGAVVTRDVPDNTTVKGCPARPIN